MRMRTRMKKWMVTSNDADIGVDLETTYWRFDDSRKALHSAAGEFLQNFAIESDIIPDTVDMKVRGAALTLKMSWPEGSRTIVFFVKENLE